MFLIGWLGYVDSPAYCESYRRFLTDRVKSPNFARGEVKGLDTALDAQD